MQAREKTKLFLKDIPWKDISQLAIPQILLMLTTLCIGLTDMWVAGQISSEVQAVIGITTQIQALIMVLAMSLGSATMAIISQSFGAKRFLRAKRYVLLVLYITFLLSCSISLLGANFGHTLMSLLDVPHEARPTALYFWDVLLLALPFHYTYFVSNVLFRASKMVKLPLIIGFIVCIINFFGDLALGLGYFGFHAYGVPGIAWTTYGAVLAGTLVSLYLLHWGKLIPKSYFLKIRWVKKALPYLFKVALPSLASQSLWQSGYLILFGIATALPNSIDALAGLSAGMRIESILFTPAMAFNATASILVGHELGAGHIKEAKKIGITIVALGAGSMSLVGFCMLPFMDMLAKIFSSDISVINIIVWYLIFNIMSTPFTLAAMILSGIMTGAGATIYSLIVNSTSIWLIRLPIAYYTGHVMDYGVQGIFFAMLVSSFYQASILLTIFFKLPWHTHTMRNSIHKSHS